MKKGTNNVPGKAAKPKPGRHTAQIKIRKKPGVNSAKGMAALAGLLGGAGPAGPVNPMMGGGGMM